MCKQNGMKYFTEIKKKVKSLTNSFSIQISCYINNNELIDSFPFGDV